MKFLSKKTTILAGLILATTVSFAQIKVDNVGKVGIGVAPDPNTDAKLIMQSANLYGLHLTNTGQSSGSYYPSVKGYGIYSDNRAHGYSGTAYGICLSNSASGTAATAYGIYSTNTLATASGTACGAYISSTATSVGTVYGVYSTVSGQTPANTYSGYFTGGKVVMMGGAVGIGRNPTAGLLDVAGSIAINGNVQLTSDERLKRNIKDVTNETEKLYKLQGKSYIKSLAPTFEMANDTIQREIKDTTTFFEYGYLAQELKEVFPELVSQDTEGYYGVNYIALIPVIVEALKDQRKTNEMQQQRIEYLEKALAGTSLKSAETGDVSTGSGSQEMYLSDIANAETLKLYQNAPNPFNERTTVKCFVPEQFQKVQLCVYNMQGVQVQCLTITERGAVSIEIEAGELSAGIYSYVLLADGAASETKQMILTK